MVHPSSSGAFLPVPPRPFDPAPAADGLVLVVYERCHGGWSATSPDVPGFAVTGCRSLPACSTAALDALERSLPPSTAIAETAPGATVDDWFPPPECADCACGEKRERFFAMVAARLAAGEPAGHIAGDHGLPVEAIESIRAAERAEAPG